MELTELQQQVAKLVLDTPAPGKHCARNAIRHITRAWEIRETDREMAAFQAITGEEESVSAIFHSLRRHRYAGSEKLNPRNHVHKAAVFPFFRCVAQVLEITNQMGLEPTIEVPKDEASNRIRVRLTVTGPNRKPIWAYPEPPLHYIVELNDKLYDFSEQLEKLASEKNCRDILSHVKSEANRRNKLLYAATDGVPAIANPMDGYLLRRRDVIFTNLIVYLMIDPYKEHQLFVRQALAAFLRMLEVLEEDDRIFDDILAHAQT